MKYLLYLCSANHILIKHNTIMNYFTITELTRSATATARGLNNTPSVSATTNLSALINNVLDPLREAWGRPITVNSGYRSPTVNAAVGGVANSQHVKGEAADTTAGSPTLNRQLFCLAISLNLPFDQLIDEHGYRWLHISHSRTKNRNQILHL